ncbi:phage gene 29 protein family protein [Rhodococcus zopfii]|uniref:phage gene 29 protein family protein n=1 Tax=Rhodococcus zopfii TaxID=43772 RepID=UPI003527E99D
MRLPLQSTCDQTKPDQAHQWLCVDLPFGQDQSFTPDHKLLPEWSQRIDDAGYRHVDQIRALANEDGFIHVDQLPQQRKRFRPPYRGQQHYLNHGVWVGMDEPDPEPFSVPDPAAHTPHEQAAMAERMYYTGVLKRAEPEPDKASISRAPFNPSDHTVASVNTYLEWGAANDSERSRVLAAEMLGKKRQQILRNPKWKGL